MPDQRILYTEEMVGASHPTKADTLNRLALVEHNSDGTHKRFESAEQTITPAGPLTLAHGLGAKPDWVQVWLVCKTAEHNYSVGDEVPLNLGPQDAGGGQYGVTVVPDATDLNVRYGNVLGVFRIHNKTTGDIGTISVGNWKAVFRAWL